MKHFLFKAIRPKHGVLVAAACATLAGCSGDGYMDDVLQGQSSEIAFSLSVPDATRAADAAAEAALLDNRFVVYGYKLGDTAAEAADGSTDTPVFDLYNVRFDTRTAATSAGTATTCDGWEYVGYTSLTGEGQTMKYWDFDSRYVFSAIACGDEVTVAKITDASTIGGTTLRDKGWRLSVPAGADLGHLYASDRREIAKSIQAPDTHYSFPTVDFTFSSLTAKVRFGFYETIPGYSVRIDRCYYGADAASSSSTHLAASGTFKGLDESGATLLTVTYDADSAPVPSYESTTTATYCLFGSHLLSQPAIGTSIADATYDQPGGTYTHILPYQSLQADTPAANPLTLLLDYTLVPEDGTDEEVEVAGVTAIIPTEYTQWKPNSAYTYLIKITETHPTLTPPHRP